MFHVGTDFEKDRLKIRFNLYSEQDGKNSLLNDDLTGSQLDLLDSIGDNLDQAIIPSVDSVGFSDDQVRYKRIDSTITVGGIPVFVPEVFVYSTNSDSALYQVQFSDAGLGNGDYIQIQTSANGRVFQWVAPDSITGERQGNFVPAQQVITPKMNQLFTLGAEYRVARNGLISVEGALSNTDLNRFSSADNDDNLGYGVKVKYDHIIPVGDTSKWAINTGVEFEHIDQNFRPIDRDCQR